MKRFFIYAGCLLALVAVFIAFEGPVRANDLSDGNNNTYEYTVVSADSEEEAITSLREQGYEPVMENIARYSSELSGEYVYVGYKASTTSSENAISGSVFSDSFVTMIWAFGLIIGVLIGMFSMKIGRAAKDKGGSR